MLVLLDECGFIIAERDEDGLLVEWFWAILEREGVGTMDDVLVKHVYVAIIADGGVNQRSAVYMGNGLHLMQSERRW